MTDFWKNIQVDIHRMESLFPELEDTFYASKNSFLKKNTTQKVSLLPLHMANNISILRSQFSKMSDQDIVKAILDVNQKPFTTLQLESLLKCVPSGDMIDVLSSYEGSLNDLRDSDKFAMTLLTIENVAEKLKSLIFCNEFSLKFYTLVQFVSDIRKEVEEVLQNEKLQSLMAVIAASVNFLEVQQQLQGKNRSLFKHTPLTKFVQLRAAKNSRFSVADFLSEFVSENFNELIPLKDSLLHLESQLRYHPELVENQYNHLKEGIQSIQQQIHEDNGVTLSYADYYQLLQNFLNDSESSMTTISNEMNSLVELIKEFYQSIGYPIIIQNGSSHNNNPLEKMIVSLHSFCENFKELYKIKQQEEKYQQILKDEEAKLRLQETKEDNDDGLSKPETSYDDDIDNEEEDGDNIHDVEDKENDNHQDTAISDTEKKVSDTDKTSVIEKKTSDADKKTTTSGNSTDIQEMGYLDWLITNKITNKPTNTV
eukprot:TRINITY_DN1098_c0_g1_i2.p1 TRINITY_DN1098_c0_g1~~TRINITY_DN1098_c0_g1_i2.p1  ORF type:complete len:483 (+),score=160.10 TRINITY_DN1098_c0_g1_i2:228-1676(+)